MKTIQEFCSELNRWLSFRWQTADHGYQLPTETAVCVYAEALLCKTESGPVGADALCRIRNKRTIDALPRTNADLAVLCAIAVKVTPDPEGADNKRVLRIVTNIEAPSEVTLAGLPMTLTAIKDGKGTVTAVTAVDTPEYDISFSDLFVEACRIQESVDTDIAERWLRQDISFREKHLICPACGGKIECASHDEKQAIHCNYCDWVSRHRYYPPDLAEENAFRQEQRFLKRIRAFDEKQTAALAKIREGIDELSALYEKPVKGYDSRYQLEQKIIEICKKLSALLQRPINSL